MAEAGILIIDDNLTNLKLARLVLDDEGYDVRTASNAVQTRQILASFQPRIVLMDLQLPVTDGLALTRELRRDARFDSTWIIALTAYAMPGDEARALAAGCDGYVTKPIDTQELATTVARFMSRVREPSSG